jgi:hypothetical protein
MFLFLVCNVMQSPDYNLILLASEQEDKYNIRRMMTDAKANGKNRNILNLFRSLFPIENALIPSGSS